MDNSILKLKRFGDYKAVGRTCRVLEEGEHPVHALAALANEGFVLETGDGPMLKLFYTNLKLVEGGVSVCREGTAYVSGESKEELKEKMGVLIDSLKLRESSEV